MASPRRVRPRLTLKYEVREHGVSELTGGSWWKIAMTSETSPTTHWFMFCRTRKRQFESAVWLTDDGAEPRKDYYGKDYELDSRDDSFRCLKAAVDEFQV